jgi:MFS family permease
MITKKMWSSLILLTIAGQMAWAVENNWFNTFVYSEITPDPRPVSWMVMCSALVSTAVTIIIGATSDRWSGRWGRRKPFIFAGYVLWGIATIIFPSAAIFKPVALAAVVVVMFDSIMSAFGSIGSDAALNAFVTDITDTSNRGRVQGILQAAMWFAFLLTAFVAGMVIDTIGYFGFFYILGGIVLLIGLLAGGLLLDEKPVARDTTTKQISIWQEIGQTFQWKSLKENRELMIVFISIAVCGLAGQIFAPYILIYFIHSLGFSATEAGLLQAAALLFGGVLSAVPLGYLSDRWGRRKTGLTIVLFQAAALVGLSLFARDQLTSVLFCSLVYIPITGWFINYKSWTRDLMPENKRGQFAGITLFFAILLPMVTGPFIGSWLTTQFGTPTVIDGQSGFIPTPLIFQVSAAATLLTLIPLYFTQEMRASRQAAVMTEAPVLKA